MDTPPHAPPAPYVVPAADRRGRPLRIVGWLAFALVLGATFRAYLDPSLSLDLASFMQMCGLR
jgi:hypothetical protein